MNTRSITITYELVKTKEDNILDESHSQFHKIVFKDNGIGFEQEHAEKYSCYSTVCMAKQSILEQVWDWPFARKS